MTVHTTENETQEVLNPKIHCAWSGCTGHENRHRPVTIYDPFTKPEKEMVDISAPIVR